MLGTGTGRAPAGGWRTAVVRELSHPFDGAVVLRLAVPDRVDHLPGQHYVVRLRAPDGYTAQRSYSVSSDPADPLLELFVERLPDGEVSSYLAEVAAVGDELEVRGPIGGWFVWDATSPAVGVAGGTGVVPLVSMLRHAARVGRADLLRLAVSSRRLDVLPYAEELVRSGALVAATREAHGERAAGRLTAAEVAGLVTPGVTAFVCGSTGFAEAAGGLLVQAGVPAAAVRVERFGPSGS